MEMIKGDDQGRRLRAQIPVCRYIPLTSKIWKPGVIDLTSDFAGAVDHVDFDELTAGVNIRLVTDEIIADV